MSTRWPACATAQGAGAEFVILCDTNGGAVPWEIEEIAQRDHRLSGLGRRTALTAAGFGIHTHDDAGVGVADRAGRASAPVALSCRARVNGVGEGVGDSDLSAAVANLQLKLGVRCLEDDRRPAPDQASPASSPRRRMWRMTHDSLM